MLTSSHIYGAIATALFILIGVMVLLCPSAPADAPGALEAMSARL